MKSFMSPLIRLGNTTRMPIAPLLLLSVGLAACGPQKQDPAPPPHRDNGLKDLSERIDRLSAYSVATSNEQRRIKEGLETKIADANGLIAKVDEKLAQFNVKIIALSNSVQYLEKLKERYDKYGLELSLKANSDEFEKYLKEFEEYKKSVVPLLLKAAQGGRSTIIYLDPTAKGFSRIDHDTGFFLVSCKDAQPYLDGYKIILNVGNPFMGTYDNTNFKIKWGKKPDDYKSISDYEEFQKTLRKKEISVTEQIRPGFWNKIELILTPAKAEDMGHIELSVEAPRVSLTNPRE